MKKIKILFITNLYPSETRPDYGVFTKDQIDLALNSGAVSGDVVVIDTFNNGLKDYFKAYKKIRKIYTQYDLIHAFHGLSMVVAYFSTKRIPILISFLNSIKFESLKSNLFINSFFSFLYEFIAKRQRVFKIFKDKLPDDKNLAHQSYYLPNGVNINEFYEIDRNDACNELALDPSKKYLLFVSSKDKMRKQKRYDIFTRVIELLKRENPEYNIEELVMSRIARSKAKYYYNVAAVHLITSDWEGSPNSVKEAMACNCPVVARNVGNISKMLENIENCRITNSDSPIIVANLVKEIILENNRIDIRKYLKLKSLDSDSKNKELVNIYKEIYSKYER